MTSPDKAEDSWWEKVKKGYTLELKSRETFETLRSWRVTGLRVYFLFLLIAFFIAALVISLIVFTPLKTLVPGYGDILKNDTYRELEGQVAEMETLIQAQEVYIENLKQRFTGSFNELNATEELASPSRQTGAIERIAEDEELRKEVARRRILQKQNQNQDKPKEIFLTAPVQGSISYPYKPEENHLGLDIVAPANSPVLAAADGYIVFSDRTEDRGNTIAVMHADNILTFYMHNSSLLKKTGDYVEAGEAIAIIGNTGKLTDGPHLHFEIWDDGKPQDPHLYINF